MALELLPKITSVSAAGESEAEMPSATYRLDADVGRVQGRIDQEAAMRQAVGKILQTQWMAHEIYDERYGLEMQGLLGKDEAYIRSEIKRRIREALMMDDRIREVCDFSFLEAQQLDALHVGFIVRTRFGEWEMQAVTTLG